MHTATRARKPGHDRNAYTRIHTHTVRTWHTVVRSTGCSGVWPGRGKGRYSFPCYSDSRISDHVNDHVMRSAAIAWTKQAVQLRIQRRETGRNTSLEFICVLSVCVCESAAHAVRIQAHLKWYADRNIPCVTCQCEWPPVVKYVTRNVCVCYSTALYLPGMPASTKEPSERC